MRNAIDSPGEGESSVSYLVASQVHLYTSLHAPGPLHTWPSQVVAGMAKEEFGLLVEVVGSEDQDPWLAPA